MHYLSTGVLEQYDISLEETRDEFPNEVCERKESVNQSIKLQKKGTTEVVSLAISEVATWDDLLKALAKSFPYPNAKPQITTFDGSLITSQQSYEPHLRPGLHLIIYFPPTIDELSQSLDTLFFENIAWTDSFKLSSNPRFMFQNSSSDASQLANYLNSPTPTPISSSEPRRYHLQPPTIYFHVPSPTPISVTLSNPAFQEDHSKKDKWPRFTNSINVSKVPYVSPTVMPTLSSGSSEYTIMKEDSGLLTKSSGDINQRLIEHYGIPGSPYRVVSGGIFPITSFDLFAQSQRRRVLCSTSWEVTAAPTGTLVDLVSGEEMPSISWAISDNEGSQMGYRRTSEKRIYANYEGPANLATENKDGKGVGWWMIGPGKLPTGFSGQMGEHTFLLKGMEEVAALLRAFMERCGIPEKIVEDFVSYWTQNLEPEKSAMSIISHGSSADAFPGHNREGTPKLILLKFLHPRDLRSLLPLSITPEPHRIVRLFAVFRVVKQEEMDMEGIDPSGDFETEVDRVLGGIGSCGGGWDCGHRGFKVAEVGGVRVFGGNDKRE